MSVASLANRSYQIQRATITKDAIGGQLKTWGRTAILKGRIQPLSSEDSLRHSKEESNVTHKGYFSGTPDIKAGDRFVFGSNYLYVIGVRNIDNADVFLTVELEERDQ